MFTIILTHPFIKSPSYDICKSILIDQGMKFSEVWDRMKAVKNGMGTINPGNGFIIETPTGEFLLNYMQLFRYMERKGLVRL